MIRNQRSPEAHPQRKADYAPGFYWVRYWGEDVIAFYDGDFWRFCTDDEGHADIVTQLEIEEVLSERLVR